MARPESPFVSQSGGREVALVAVDDGALQQIGKRSRQALCHREEARDIEEVNDIHLLQGTELVDSVAQSDENLTHFALHLQHTSDKTIHTKLFKI